MKFINRKQAKDLTGISYLGAINHSAKLKKNGKINHQYTYAIYLAPYTMSGYNLCRFSTPECRKGCLNTSGRAGMDIVSGRNQIMPARIKKARLLVEHRDFFMAWMIAEINSAIKKAERDGYGFSVRLNATSDVNWIETKYKGKWNIFEIFPDVKFYDYTKDHTRFDNVPKNYFLTYSYTGRNWKHCENLLHRGFNVAMVFKVRNEKHIPNNFRGYEVINGDITDYRIADKQGIIVGLKWKSIADKQAEKEVLNSCFVVDPKDKKVMSGIKELNVTI